MGITFKYATAGGIVGKYAAEMAKGEGDRSRQLQKILTDRQQQNQRFRYDHARQQAGYRHQEAMQTNRLDRYENMRIAADQRDNMQGEIDNYQDAIRDGSLVLDPKAEDMIKKKNAGRALINGDPKRTGGQRSDYDGKYYSDLLDLYRGGTSKPTQPTPTDVMNKSTGHFGDDGKWTSGGKDGGMPTHWVDPKTGEPHLIDHGEPAGGGTSRSRGRKSGGGAEVPGLKEWESARSKLQKERGSLEDAMYKMREELRNQVDTEGVSTAPSDAAIEAKIKERFGGRMERLKENESRLGEEPGLEPPPTLGPQLPGHDLTQPDMDAQLGDLMTRSGIQSPKTPEERAALAPGSTYMDPDGQMRQVPGKPENVAPQPPLAQQWPGQFEQPMDVQGEYAPKAGSARAGAGTKAATKIKRRAQFERYRKLREEQKRRQAENKEHKAAEKKKRRRRR